MSEDPVKKLTDTLTLLRVEIADVKSRQITNERLMHLQAALEDNAKQISGVKNAAAIGGKEGASRLSHSLDQTARDISNKVNTAVQSLSQASREASSTILARRRNVRLLMGLSAITGLAVGALLSLLVFDYYLERDFGDTVRLLGFDWACTKHGGFINEQDSGKYCVFNLRE